MKTVLKAGSLLLLFLFVSGCATRPEKTIENLKYAFNGESTASAKYAAFAEKAVAEGFDTVAVMFLAISKAEAIHAENHKKVLEKLGEKVGPTETGKFEVMTTAENLADALKVETGGVDSMYPGFITTAETEKATDAYKTFTWAVDTEKRYQVFFRTAIDALAAGGEKNLALKWFVCPVCGNTYDERDVSESCDFCMTSKEKYLVFQAP